MEIGIEGRTVQVVTGQLVDDNLTIGLAELCSRCNVPAETILTLVEEGVIEPRDRGLVHWTFTLTTVRRASVAIRLQRDLDVNLPGVALALELLDRIDGLEARLR